MFLCRRCGKMTEVITLQQRAAHSTRGRPQKEALEALSMIKIKDAVPEPM